MKYLLLIATIGTTIFAACNNGNNNPSQTAGDSTPTKKEAASTAGTATPVKDILGGYLQLKNALANDNGNDAATAGNTMVDAFQKIDTSALTPAQKKTYADVQDDAREHAEHIGKNAANVPHQREHFDMLSKDMYELVKTFGAGQPLYKDSCPMYNDGKGAIWLSELKGIKNPYLGKKMPTCGTVKEELK
ncbi:MAG TPA: DUF3347 domain-containing protein [Puia sp.]|uniref:DUF3347 domain-containing protein n=1 Tax=Puia sp. TaxID=2045100 RepID=UPI000927F63E|nr:DUF3347 domain-containing protein [Puia sp.]MBN8852737.1 DUF3347 domain-containing protein [Sphingobacteriales bacterium]OJW55557.1 MAG: hypothetical protein BGO55_03170 [Sphingobacteriales bacterium 50-39]HVU96861.1 DUF3347 domain-containing protein [Puia sp.]